jgi:hypothetical protein
MHAIEPEQLTGCPVCSGPLAVIEGNPNVFQPLADEDRYVLSRSYEPLTGPTDSSRGQPTPIKTKIPGQGWRPVLTYITAHGNNHGFRNSFGRRILRGRFRWRRSPAKVPAQEPAAPVLLSGGNPQIAKADGDAPVQAYIAAMPDWKRDVGRCLDALIVQTVPNVRKAVRWNTPFYGIEGRGLVPRLPLHHEVHQGDILPWHVAASCPTPVESKQKEVRYFPHPRGRSARRGALVKLDSASIRAAR